MRVISQDGTLDLPYERIVISSENSGSAYYLLGFSDCTSIGLVIAMYSTEEKAKNAMDLLHETYVGKLFISVNENVEFDNNAKELLKNATILCTPNVDVRPIGDSRNVVFRFPADSEV